ncbi:MAG: DUF4124 domain-containing protein [Moraxellaceae bacterium]|nr:DUF4124 domain-containing protein [Moraxellaceae bacterium]
MNIRFALCLLLAVSTSAAAQQIYKTVGPDGKVVFSDQPPDATETRYVAPSSGNAAPQAAERPAYGNSSPAAEQAAPRFQAKRAERADPVPAQPAPVPLDQALQKALLGVAISEDAVNKMEKLCVSTLPTSFKKYNGAAESWRKRNANLISRQRAVLQEVSDASGQQRLNAIASAEIEKKMVTVRKASMAQRIAWCDQSAAELSSGKMDIHNSAMFAPPLLNYKSTRR